jgi:NAD-dependent SIR2 family protein deacetylase
MEVTSAHTQITVRCDHCGAEYDIEDYDSQTMEAATTKAMHSPCRDCEDNG